MKNSLEILSRRVPVLLAAAGLLTTGFHPAAGAAGVTTWSGAGADQNWSTTANWSTVGGTTPPGAGDTVIFNVTGAAAAAGTVNNIVDSGFTAALGALTISNDTATTFHTMQIPAGNTLTINGPIFCGGSTFTTIETFTGDGTLLVGNGTNTVTVAAVGTGSAAMTLDLSQLTNFVCDAGGAGGAFSVGLVNPASGTSGGTFNLAAGSNSITASTITVGENNNGGSTSILNLGSGTNTLNAGAINIGWDKASGSLLQFYTNTGTLQLRNAAGTGRATITLCGNAHSGSSSARTVGTVALAGHYVDMMIGTLTLAQRNARTSGSDNGYFSFDTGIVDVSTINMANNTSGGSAPFGYVSVGGGTLKVGNISFVNCAGAGGTGSLTITNGGLVTCSGSMFKTTPVGTGTITNYGGILSLTSGASIGVLTNPVDFMTMSNATLVLGSISPNTTNIFLANLDTENGGDSTVLNTISIALLPGISSFPAYYHLILYTNGAAGITGAGTNFVVTGISSEYTYYITNYTAAVSGTTVGFVDLAVTAGPAAKAITWRGTPTANWNTTDLDWLLSGAPTNFNQGDFVTFDDTASGATTINLSGLLEPSAVTVNNTAKAYTFDGNGSLGGASTLVKQGANTLLFDNSGNNTFSGAITISAGAVQLGNADANGNLGLGTLNNNGALIVNRTDSPRLGNSLAGGGGLTNLGTGTLTVAGVSPSYSGAVMVAHGTLKLGASTALGTTNAGVLIANGAMLDLGGYELTNIPVTAAGAGVGSAGAIVNSGASIFPALTSLTLAGDTTLGGSGRWDLRSLNTADATGASLSTLSQAYNIIKTGTNTVSISGVTVDPALGNLDVQQGVFSIESATTSLGNPSSTVTVELGAALQLYQLTNLLNKVVVLNGNGTNATLINNSGANTVVGPVTLNGSNLVNAAGTSLTLAGPIDGAGSLTEIGGAYLSLRGNNTYTNTTTVTNGTLALNGINSGLPGLVTGLTNTTIVGVGTNVGAVIVSGNLNPGDVGVAGTLTTGSLTLAPGATATFDLSTTTTVGGGVNDLVQVNGDLTLNSNTLLVNLPQGTLAAGTYRLINYTGSLSGSFNPTLQLSIGGATRYTLALDTSTPGQINLVVGGSTANLVWDGTADNTWDVGITPNWLNAATAMADVFYDEDTVLLDDTAGVQTSLNLTNTITTSAITNNSSVNNFSLSGPGRITGPTSIVKLGSSTLLLGTSNDFSGTVTVAAGTLLVTNNGSLGTTNGATIILSGATLDLGASTVAQGLNLGQEPILVAGSGVGGNGAIINSSSLSQYNSIRNITLAGDAWFGGPGNWTGAGNPGRWDVRGGPATLSTSGHPFNLYKVGGNQVSVVTAAVDTNLANIDIQGGMLGFENNCTSMGNPSSNLIVEAGATLEFYHSTASNVYTKQFVLNGNGLTPTITNWSSSPGVTTLNGQMTLNGAVVIGINGTAITNNCLTVGSGSLIKAGVGSLVLTAANTYSGNTTIASGALLLAGNGSIANSPVISLAAANAMLNASTRVDGAFTLASGQTLTGIGTVVGDVTAGANTTLSPGNANNTTLSVNGTLVMNGCTNSIALAVPNGDNLIAVTNLTLNGVSTLAISAQSTLYVGNVHTVMQYSGTLTGGAANLQVVGLGGFSFSLVDPATTPGQIEVTVTAVPANFVWRGGVPGAETNWNTVTKNWYDPNLSNQTNFMTGVLAQFDDNYNPPYTNLNLVGALNPLAMDFQNGSTIYTLQGSGRLTGNGGLTMDSYGGVVIANAGVNDFAGDINLLGGGTLQIGVGGTRGNVGGGNINATNGFLIFDRSDNINVANNLNGPSSLTNLGTGVLTLSGNNTLSGPITVAQGTLQVNNNAALGGPAAGGLVVWSGATLDLGGPSFAAQGENLSNEVVVVSGSGVGGFGAIINSSTNSQYNALRNIMVVGDTWFGGPGNWLSTNASNPGRWDLRGSVANCALVTSNLQPYSLYKVGSNHVGLVGVTIDNTPGQSLGNIYVQQGKLQIESGTTSLGDINSNLTVSAGATLGFYQSSLTNNFTKQFVLNGDGSTVTLTNESGTTTLNGSMTLNGGCVFGIGGTVITNNCSLTGAGNLTLNGAARLVLNNPAIGYSGNTIVNNGTLQLVGAIPSSPLFDIAGSNAVLDVSGAGGTLALNSGQAIRGGGTLRGNLNAGGTAAVSVGESASLGILTVTNAVTLGGSSATTMKLSRTGAATNDVLKAGSTLGLGGTLNVTLLGGTPVAGDTFVLFKAAGGLSGTFSVTNLQALPTGLAWVTTNLVNGILSVIATINTNPTNLTANISGGLLTLSWPADHTGWRLLAQTNSLAAGLNPNPDAWSTVPGSTSVNTVNITLDPNQTTVFYRLVYP